MQTLPQAKIFIISSSKDLDIVNGLTAQMNLVKQKENWSIWFSEAIKAGEDWHSTIKSNLRDANVVIMVLSSDFFNSNYIAEVELPAVLKKHKAGKCQIIPIIGRQCHWKDTPFGGYFEKFGDIQALPKGEKPIVSKGAWDNNDQPYFEAVQSIKEAIRLYMADRVVKPKATRIEVQNAKEITESHLESVATSLPQEKAIVFQRPSKQVVAPSNSFGLLRPALFVIFILVVLYSYCAWKQAKRNELVRQIEQSEPQYDYIDLKINENRRIVKRGSILPYYGFVDSNRTEVIHLQYRDAKPFNEGKAAVLNLVGRWGFIDINGKDAIPFDYEYALSFKKGRAAVKQNGLWGVISNNGNWLVRPLYYSISELDYDGLYYVQGLDHKFGVLDSNSNIIIPPTFDSIGLVRRGLAIVFQRSLPKPMSLINIKCEQLSANYDIIASPTRMPFAGLLVMNGSLYGQGAARKYGIIGYDGKEIINPEYDEIHGDYCSANPDFVQNKECFPNNETNISYSTFDTRFHLTHRRISTQYHPLFVIKKSGEYGFVDLKGRIIKAPSYADIYGFNEGFAGVRKGTKWNFINLKGDSISRISFDEIKSFSNGMAAVKIDSFWGYINTNGRLILDPKRTKFLNAGDFIGDTAIVQVDINTPSLQRSYEKYALKGGIAGSNSRITYSINKHGDLLNFLTLRTLPRFGEIGLTLPSPSTKSNK